jgi:histidinol-phosphate aminotransferase
LISQPDNIEQLLKIRGPYDINQLAVVAAEAALESPEYTQDYVAEVMQKSRPLLESWLAQHGVPYWPSEANFLWTFPQRATELAVYLQQQNILVRPKADSQGREGVRINLGTVEQTRRLIDALDAFYQA